MRERLINALTDEGLEREIREKTEDIKERFREIEKNFQAVLTIYRGLGRKVRRREKELEELYGKNK